MTAVGRPTWVGWAGQLDIFTQAAEARQGVVPLKQDLSRERAEAS